MSKKKVKIENIPLEGKRDGRPFKHNCMFEVSYPSLFLVAKKNSGKSMTVYNLLKYSIDKRTKLIIFSSTFDFDNTYISMINYFRKKGVKVLAYHSIYEEVPHETKPGKFVRVNILRELMDEIANPEQQEEPEPNITKKQKDEFIQQQKELEHYCCLMTGKQWSPKEEENKEVSKINKCKESKKDRVPKYYFVFDDLSKELRDSSIPAFLKVHRHYHAMSIISSQYPKDLEISGRKQIDSWILFKGHDLQKLEGIHSDCGSNISLDKFVDAYHDATSKAFSFLHVNTRENTLNERFDGKQYYKKEDDIMPPIDI